MKSWILLSKEEAECGFWKSIDFPNNIYGGSAYEIRCGHRNCKNDWDVFIEKEAFQVFYNPISDTFRVYLTLFIPKTVKIIDPDPLYIKDPEFITRVERFWVNRKDFKDCLVPIIY